MRLLAWLKTSITGHDFDIIEGPPTTYISREEVLDRKACRTVARIERLKLAMDSLRKRGLEKSDAFESLAVEYVRLNGGNV